jgi:hypothetical protein
VWIALLALVPFAGFIMAIVLGIKGREWAWKNKKWDSVEHFNRVQRRWSVWAVWLMIVPFVVGILSAANVLKGEQQVLAFPDIRPNREVVAVGEVLATTTIDVEERDADQVRRRLNLLLAAAYAKAQRQGTLTDGLQYDPSAFNQLGRRLTERPAGQTVALEAVALRAAETPDPIVVELRVVRQGT